MTGTDAHVAFVALGSNLGDRDAHLAAARAGLAALLRTRVTGTSRVEETAPIGPSGQGPYRNQMLRLETRLDAHAVLAAGQALERASGRVRDETARWGARTLDVDIVLFGDVAIDTPALRVPHPEIAHRDFWQRELAELGVDWQRAVAAATAARPAHAGASA